MSRNYKSHIAVDTGLVGTRCNRAPAGDFGGNSGSYNVGFTAYGIDPRWRANPFACFEFSSL